MPLGPRPFIPAAGVCQLNAFYRQGGEECENVYHFKKGSGAEWTAAELTTLKGMFDAWETAFGRAQRTQDTVLFKVRCLDLTVAGGAVLEQASDIPGTMAINVEAQSNTVAVKANTGFSGRSKRGRTYWIGLNPNLFTQGHISTGYIDNIIIALNGLIAAAATNTTPLVVTSFSTAGAWRAAAVSTIVQNWSVADDKVDSQRRRLPNH